MQLTSFTVKSSVEIKRSVEDVFAYVVDGFFEHRAARNPNIRELVKTSPGPMAVGTTGREITADKSGYLSETLYTATAYEPNHLFAIQTTSNYLDKLANGRDVPALYERLLSGVWSGTIRYEFTSHEASTRLLIQAQYKGPATLWTYITYPIWMGSYRETSFKALYRLRDLLEKQAGLPKRRRPFRVKRTWVVWGVYLLILAMLFWLHSMRVSLGLSADLVNLLRAVMSAMVALALATLFVIISVQSTARSRAEQQQKQP